MAQKQPKLDREVEQFRNLMQTPSRFDEGFNWTTVLAVAFIALLMVPGALYMSLLAGAGIGPAAQWVTVILFIEVARRAHRELKRAEIFVLFFMSGAALSVYGSALGVPFQGLLWNQFYARSDAAAEMGIAAHLPHWFAPGAESSTYQNRTFFHLDWLPAMGLFIFGTLIAQMSNLILGYGLFRITSDIEKLPFPLAPIGAQGVMALATDADDQDTDRDTSWRWRVFSIGGAIGLAFGSVYLLLPTVTGALIGEPVEILPIPFSDFTDKTDGYLPAVATGVSWDLGNLLTGMVLPYFAMVGSFLGLVITVVVNPILYEFGVLDTWRVGDNTVITLFKNNVDFYFSFTIGVSLAIAAAGMFHVVQALHSWRRRRREDADVITDTFESSEQQDREALLRKRGDIRIWILIAAYIVTTLSYILLSGYLIDWHKGVMIVMLILGFVYTPLLSYATARLEGMVGEVVEPPLVKQAALIFSGFKGVDVWFLPMPIANYGMMTVYYRQCELTGTRFTSIWKATAVLYPIMLISVLFFSNFIWSLAEIPSAVYPYADMIWELDARNQSIMYTSTLGEYSVFEEAFDPWQVAAGGGFGLLLFFVLSGLGLPVFLIYGVVRGLGQSLPHVIIPQFIGALIGRYYFERRLGLKWRQYIPVVAAGYACGAGLITIVGVGIMFLSKAVISIPY